MNVIEMHREVAETLRGIKTGADRLLELLHQMGSPIYARNRLEMMQQVLEETTQVMLAAMTRDCPDEDAIATYRPDLVQDQDGDPSMSCESSTSKPTTSAPCWSVLCSEGALSRLTMKKRVSLTDWPRRWRRKIPG